MRKRIVPVKDTDPFPCTRIDQGGIRIIQKIRANERISATDTGREVRERESLSITPFHQCNKEDDHGYFHRSPVNINPRQD